MEKINEKKLKAFIIGAMGKQPLSRKEQEVQRKKMEEEAAANVFKEFVETFQEEPTSSKIWVKAGTYDAGSRVEDHREKGKLYKPGAKLIEENEGSSDSNSIKLMSNETHRKESINLKKKSQEKKKSNLELFKEELRQIQEEREERHKYKSMARQVVTHEPESSTKETESGSFDNGDPNTTNLYLGNLSPKITEQQLMDLFGRYGPLASIKIMWPRSEEEKSRGRNCGFVAYMSRKDAERALKNLNGRDILGYEMRLGWGKSVPILNQPMFIPPSLLEYTMPPTQSGLPFNAQPTAKDLSKLPEGNFKTFKDEEKKNGILNRATIKVVTPSEKLLLLLIHRMIEFVIREGPMFEAIIMSREMENPMFTFLFDNECSAHTYYRWKLFSLLQGDTTSEWNEKEFRMFKGGSIWKPPSMNFYNQGMPEELIVDDEATDSSKGALSSAQRDRLEFLIRHLTPERKKIGEAMIFCVEHAEAADEICECINQSLSNSDTLMSKKIARLYLVSDILHNCTVKVTNASIFRKTIEKNLIEIFQYLHNYYAMMESRLKSAGFKSRVMKIFAAWDEWAIYPRDFLRELKHIFLGKTNESKAESENFQLSSDEKEDELDGVPLDGAALLKGAILRGVPEAVKAIPSDTSKSIKNDEYDDDIDGMPLYENIDGIPLENLSNYKNTKTGEFIPSKWEMVAPEQIEAQAITTSKWDTLQSVTPKSSRSYDSDDNSSKIDNFKELKRNKLRDIEVKVLQYQDDLESGRKEIKTGWSMVQQIEHYRKKLVKKETESDSRGSSWSTESSSSKKLKRKYSSPGRDYQKSYSNDRKRNRSRSFSPPNKKHDRSPKSPRY